VLPRRAQKLPAGNAVAGHAPAALAARATAAPKDECDILQDAVVDVVAAASENAAPAG
jgi:hypothetical protein